MTPLGAKSGDVVDGKYRIDRAIGEGGMGVVFLATHVQLDRRVAIKLLLPETASNAEAVARFEREAKATAKLESEHVVRILDVGIMPSGAPFIVMEYLEGRDLAHLIAERQLSVREAADLIVQACDALADAHAHGIVHRDIKPANLFLTQRKGSVFVKVLDFGISKWTSTTSRADFLTNSKVMMGTPLYAPPEQLLDAKDVDRRADIWALGVVLFEALTRVQPFAAAEMPMIVARILHGEAPNVMAFRPEVPAALDRVIRQCLARDPMQRYANAAELAVALRPFVGPGATSTSATVIAPAPKERRPIPIWVSIGAATLVVTLVAGALVALVSRAPVSGSGIVTNATSLLPSASVSARAETSHVSPVATTVSSGPPVVDIEGLPRSDSIVDASARLAHELSPGVRDAMASRTSDASGGAAVAEPDTCDPPYTTDARGHVHFKPSCVGSGNAAEADASAWER